MENTLLNLIPAAYLPEIHLSQYDVGRTITFTLKDGASDYSVPSGASVKVKATKPSGFGFEVACTFNGGTVTLVTTDTMTPENGRFPAELSIVSGNTTIGTSNFIFNIERSPHPEGTIDGDAETILPELTLLVERIEAAADSVDADTQIVTDAKAEVLQAKADTLQAKADTLSARDESVSAKDLAVSSAQTSVEASQRAEELVGSVETKADAIVKTASGEIASFSDGGDELPVKSLLVNIEPKQSGSGDPSPSNVRPISGYDGVNVTRCGKNLLVAQPTRAYNFTFDSSKATLVKAGVQYHYSFESVTDATSWRVGFNLFDLNGSKMKETAGASQYFTVTPDRIEANGTNTYYTEIDNRTNKDFTFVFNQDCYIMFGIYFGDTSASTVVNNAQLELGSTATAYEPYQGTSYPISLGQTVYGGTLDVLSGELVINKGMVDLGSLTWAKETNSNRFSASIPNTFKQISGGVVINAICSMYKVSSRDFVLSTNNAFSVHYSAGANYLNIHDDNAYSTMTAEQFKTYLNGQTLVCELQNPITVQLTANQVTTLLGNNNIWADSGSVEVEYRADTTLAYNELLSLIASLS